MFGPLCADVVIGRKFPTRHGSFEAVTGECSSGVNGSRASSPSPVSWRTLRGFHRSIEKFRQVGADRYFHPNALRIITRLGCREPNVLLGRCTAPSRSHPESIAGGHSRSYRQRASGENQTDARGRKASPTQPCGAGPLSLAGTRSAGEGAERTGAGTRSRTTARARRPPVPAACFPGGPGGRRLAAARRRRDGGIPHAPGRARSNPCRPRCGRIC